MKRWEPIDVVVLLLVSLLWWVVGASVYAHVILDSPMTPARSETIKSILLVLSGGVTSYIGFRLKPDK